MAPGWRDNDEMRVLLALVVAVAGCGRFGFDDFSVTVPDATSSDSTPPGDTTSCTPRVLLAGGTDPTTQGWTIQSQTPFTLSYAAGDTIIDTTNTGLCLLVLDAGLVPPFALEVTLRVETVDAHNQFDAGVALLVGYSLPPFGSPTDRAQMVYFDNGAIGWADDTQSAQLATTTEQRYRLDVDAGGKASFGLAGAPLLSRTGFATNGTIALGDQTNDANVNSRVHIREVRTACP